MIDLLVVALVAVGAQDADFLDRARAATRRFTNRDSAIAAGYRALGPDAPAMGQHWMNPGLVIAGVFDAGRPQVLTYIMVDGRPEVAGVAWAIPFSPGDSLPGGVAPREAWHFHGRSVDEESFLASHDHSPSLGDGGTRVAVLHAWIWKPNPEGMFAADNWALPFIRLGLPVPAPFNRDAARALALALPGGAAFMRRTFTRLTDPEARKAEVERWLSARNGPVSPSEIELLAGIWSR